MAELIFQPSNGYPARFEGCRTEISLHMRVSCKNSAHPRPILYTMCFGSLFLRSTGRGYDTMRSPDRSLKEAACTSPSGGTGTLAPGLPSEPLGRVKSASTTHYWPIPVAPHAKESTRLSQQTRRWPSCRYMHDIRSLWPEASGTPAPLHQNGCRWLGTCFLLFNVAFHGFFRDRTCGANIITTAPQGRKART